MIEGRSWSGSAGAAAAPPAAVARKTRSRSWIVSSVSAASSISAPGGRLVRRAEVVVRLDVARLLRDRLLELLDRALPALLLEEADAHVVVRLRVVGDERDRRLEVLRRALVVAVVEVDDPEVHVG